MSRPQQIPVQLVAKFLFLWSHTHTQSCGDSSWRRKLFDTECLEARGRWPNCSTYKESTRYENVSPGASGLLNSWYQMDAWHCITEEEGLSVPFSPCASCLWACRHSKLHIHWPLFCPLGRAWRGEQGGLGLENICSGLTLGLFQRGW